jgi:hypothetical protein
LNLIKPQCQGLSQLQRRAPNPKKLKNKKISMISRGYLLDIMGQKKKKGGQMFFLKK